VDKAVAEGKTYSYKLQPISTYVGAYRTRQSSVQSILRIGAPTLNTPENKDNGILLTWKPNANSPAVKEYRVWRADDEWGYAEVNDTLIATVDGNVTEYLDPIVNFREPGLAYRVEALLEDGSVVASLTKVTFRMPTPIIREAHKITSNMANVIWEGEGYANGHQIRLVNKSTGQSRIVTNTDGWGYAEVSGLVAGVTYEISVRHFNNYVGNRIYSAWSAPFTLNG